MPRLRITILAAAGVAAAAGAYAAYRSGLVHVPDVEQLIRDIGPELGGWTYVLVAGLAFLESGAFVGLVAPGEFAVIFGGFVAGQGLIDPIALTFLVSGAATAGDVTSFVLGRRLGRRFLDRHGPRVGLDPRRIDALDGFYSRHGGKTIVLGRFVGLARALSPFVAGTSQMRLRRFLLVDPPAAVIWSATFVALGFVFWESFDRAVALARRGNLILFAAVCVGVLIVVGVRARRRARAR